MQQLSAITRKRLAIRAVERLQHSQAALTEIKASVSTLEDHTSDYDGLLETGQQENAKLEDEIAKAKRDNEQLLSRVSELENTVTSFEVKVHELNRKVCKLHGACQLDFNLQGVNLLLAMIVSSILADVCSRKHQVISSPFVELSEPIHTE